MVLLKLQSRNKKSEPQQKIHRITNTFPSNPASPFFDSDEPIKRLGVIRLRRVHPEAGSSNICDEEKEFKAGEDFVGATEVDTKDADLGGTGKKKGTQTGEGKEEEKELTEEQLEALLLGPEDRCKFLV